MSAGFQVSGNTLRLIGSTVQLDDSAWDDLRIVPSAFDFAGNADPALVNWQPGGSGVTFRAWEFAANDEAFFLVQLPHNWKVGTSLKPHVHWTPHTRGSAESGKTVAWKMSYSAASIGSAFPASDVVDMTDTCTGTNHLHEISPAGTISGASLGISSMLICRIFRDTGDNWATNTTGNLPLLLEVDIHYEIDGFGSSGELSK